MRVIIQLRKINFVNRKQAIEIMQIKSETEWDRQIIGKIER